MLINYAVYYYSVHDAIGKGRNNSDLERGFRSKGLGFYGSCKLQSDGRFHTNITSTRFRLKIQNRENHSKYGKGTWIVRVCQNP
ncbi:hypothetical protein BX666DRAFT_1943986 [Dichotomocladium elegans]|nr:hypothetical protein BX666DRAFT_1943986 [Dichotomocladium elegans]